MTHAQRAGSIFKARRKQLGLSAAEVGAHLGINKASVYQFEAGLNNYNMATVARYFGAVGLVLVIDAVPA